MGELDLDVIRRAFREDDHLSVERALREHPELRKRVNEPIGQFDSPAITLVKSPEMLDVLLAAGADIDGRSRWWAGGFGLLDLCGPELAAYAIERGARLDVHSASRLGMADELRRMLDEHPSLVLARGGDGQTPLHFAATAEIAKMLLEHGAEIDSLAIDHPSTPAEYMVRSRQDVAKFLISQGCRTDIRMAAALGDRALASAILDRDPTAIRMGVSDEYFEMIGARSGGTIYQWELGWYVSAHQVAKEFGHDEVFQLLMERSPIEVKVLTACWVGDEELLDGLDQSRCVYKPEDLRQVAHAARNNDLAAVRLMLRAALPADSSSQHGATALHWACFHGNSAMVKELLDAGASLDVRDPVHDSTPLDWAEYGSTNGWYVDRGDYAATIEQMKAAGAPAG